MQPPTRRNDPCPCGSGRRYKECHGSLAAPGAAVEALLQRSLAAHRQGRVDEAERGYREALQADPGNAVATHYLGLAAWQRTDLAAAESLMRESIRADPAIADFHNNLGLLLRDTRRIDEAVACFARTLEVDPAWYEAHNNLGLALEAAGRHDDALAAYRDAIAAQPAFAVAHQNLGRALLARGDFAAGWAHYRWRLAAQGLARSPPDPAVKPLPAALHGRRFVLRSEQGLGDVLFFLRFAPELVRRGAALAFRGDARLHGMLGRTGLFTLGIAEGDTPAAGLESIFIGDLPWLLGANDPARFPEALALAPLPERVARMRALLEAAGPRPWIALTWRGGVASSGPARTQVKEIEAAWLGDALRGSGGTPHAGLLGGTPHAGLLGGTPHAGLLGGTPHAGLPGGTPHAGLLGGTWIGIQRLPRPGEREAFSAALGAKVHDFSATNDDLEDMLALLSLADEYIGVSNANAHLRASAGRDKTMQVLVPHPPEWRWGLEGARSPWFPAMRVTRQQPEGRWEALHRG